MVLDSVLLKYIGSSSSIGFDVNADLVATLGVMSGDKIQFKILTVKKANGQVKEVNFIQTKKITKYYKIIIKAKNAKGLMLENGDVLDIDYLQKINVN